MTEKELYYRWEWRLQSSPQAMWPLFANTNRVNRDVGLFAIETAVDPTTVRNQLGRHLRYQLPVPFWQLEYDEEPFEWVYPYQYRVGRRFRNGPLDSLRIFVQLTPLAAGGSHLLYEAWAQPKGALSRFGSHLFLSQFAAKRFDQIVRRYDRLAMGEAVVTPVSVVMSPGAAARLPQMATQLHGRGLPPPLVDHLITLINQADDLTLTRLRPYACADAWGHDRKTVLELFLHATRVGLLDLQWELLCPMCRGADDRIVNHLADLTTQAHCASCQITFDAQFEQSVELTFTPNSAIRHVPRFDYCMAGPEITPHVVAQQLLPAHQSRQIQPLLQPGRYRLRQFRQANVQLLRVVGQDDHGRDPTPMPLPTQTTTDEPLLSQHPTIQLHNHSDQPQLFILERTAWSDQAATAAQLFTLQRFRDLFAQEALRPGEQIGVGSLTVLFTDLVDSTRIYREIGDAPAFGLVMNHFDLLRRLIDEADGAIVKTIGDAVMAVFRRPLAAVQAMQKAQLLLRSPASGLRPLALKAAIHTGPSIAVTLNERLDYFGSTVNMAARLEKFAHGNELILSNNSYSDPELQQFLQEHPTAFTVSSFAEPLKGFDGQRFQLWRLQNGQPL